MQLPGHLAINYAAWLLVFGETGDYLIPYLIATVAVDGDHVIPLIKKKAVPKGAYTRTRLHELFGFIVYGIIALGIWLINETLGTVIALAVVLHLTTDFLIGESRPFLPYSNIKIKLAYVSRPLRWFFEIAFPAGLLIYLLWTP